ncbi:MAG: hypothetical protein H5T62_07445, partial [Anaerolineae bacterium]|nr:hypothetical protein [Anaerolineae bacterium]
EESGAALLRKCGHPHARACQLRDPTPIAHALATLDVRLAALAAGLTVQTEQKLSFGQDVIRPDNLLTLPDGTRALFETEQGANPALLRRILKGLQNKLAFFRSQESRAFSPTVRVLFNLTRNRDWDSTLAVWERALALLAQQHGTLPFRLLAMPLPEFLHHPDWAEPPDPQRWEDLLDPASLPSFGPTQPVESDRAPLPAPRKQRLPQELHRALAPHDDRLILAAYWQSFREQAQGQLPQADPAFFDLITLIHAASHDEARPPLAQAALPRASLYLLAKYLQMHPDLRKALNKALTRGSGSMKWSPTTILQRMQQVIRVFLKFHGFTPDGPLMVAAELPPWDRPGPRDFQVSVGIHTAELLMGDRDGVVPGQDTVRRVEQALAWVLWALFAYAEEVGLKRAPFW